MPVRTEHAHLPRLTSGSFRLRSAGPSLPLRPGCLGISTTLQLWLRSPDSRIAAALLAAPRPTFPSWVEPLHHTPHAPLSQPSPNGNWRPLPGGAIAATSVSSVPRTTPHSELCRPGKQTGIWRCQQHLSLRQNRLPQGLLDEWDY